jgi:cyclic-di-GMP-binding biofilm dispersal mediator protein
MDLTDRTVLVLGATGVFGSLLAERLHRAGASPVLAGRDPDRLEGLDLPGIRVRGDLRVAADCRRMVREAVAAGGGLDGVVNAAGVVAFGAVEDLDDAVLDDLFQTNVLGPLRVIRAALPHLAERAGFVLAITGVVAAQPVAGMAAYSASKAALSASMAALGREVRRAGITVTEVMPPHTETGLAGRAIAGRAPRMPEGLAPELVADRMMSAVLEGERRVEAAAFG